MTSFIVYRIGKQINVQNKFEFTPAYIYFPLCIQKESIEIEKIIQFPVFDVLKRF